MNKDVKKTAERIDFSFDIKGKLIDLNCRYSAKTWMTNQGVHIYFYFEIILPWRFEIIIQVIETFLSTLVEKGLNPNF